MDNSDNSSSLMSWVVGFAEVDDDTAFFALFTSIS